MDDRKSKEMRSTWSGFEQLVAYRLDDAKDRLERIEGQVGKMETELKAVEIKSGIWGLMAGLIPAAIIIILGLFGTGCAMTAQTTANTGMNVLDSVSDIGNTAADAKLDALIYIGGLSMIGGIAALVITSGRFGIRAVAIGCGCLLLNYAVARYAAWVFIPVLIATGAVSLAYGWRIVKQAFKYKKEHEDD
tara:strand:- start:2490 stop:3062 length:573 start_codon:yes stop_codon:yes gene_type:complete